MNLLDIQFFRNDKTGGMRFEMDSNAHDLNRNERAVIANMLRDFANDMDHDIVAFQGHRTCLKPKDAAGV